MGNKMRLLRDATAHGRTQTRRVEKASKRMFLSVCMCVCVHVNVYTMCVLGVRVRVCMYVCVCVSVWS